jgi:hypothetical protein
MVDGRNSFSLCFIDAVARGGLGDDCGRSMVTDLRTLAPSDDRAMPRRDRSPPPQRRLRDGRWSLTQARRMFDFAQVIGSPIKSEGACRGKRTNLPAAPLTSWASKSAAGTESTPNSPSWPSWSPLFLQAVAGTQVSMMCNSKFGRNALTIGLQTTRATRIPESVTACFAPTSTMSKSASMTYLARDVHHRPGRVPLRMVGTSFPRDVATPSECLFRDAVACGAFAEPGYLRDMTSPRSTHAPDSRRTLFLTVSRADNRAAEQGHR